MCPCPNGHLDRPVDTPTHAQPAGSRSPGLWVSPGYDQESRLGPLNMGASYLGPPVNAPSSSGLGPRRRRWRLLAAVAVAAAAADVRAATVLRSV